MRGRRKRPRYTDVWHTKAGWTGTCRQLVLRDRRSAAQGHAKHQVTLPAQAMAEAGLRAGDRLRVTATEPGRLTLVREESALETYAGRLTGTYPPHDLDNLRDEWR